MIAIVSQGDTVTGQFSYNSDLAQAYDYFYYKIYDMSTDPSYSLSMQSNGNSFGGPSFGKTAAVGNDTPYYGGYPSDFYYFYNYGGDYTANANGTQALQVYFHEIDANNPLSSTQLPSTTPNLSQWDLYKQFYIAGYTPETGYYEFTGDITQTMQGANPVPEPMSAMLLGTGLLGAFGLKRRNGRASA